MTHWPSSPIKTPVCLFFIYDVFYLLKDNIASIAVSSMEKQEEMLVKAPAHRAPRATERTFYQRRQDERGPRLLPEHVDLGLRLTVGEEVNQKPFLPSSQGTGHFPEQSAFTESNINPYYPATGATEAPAYICSPPSTLIALIVVILVINVIMVAAFIIFYRKKRKYWSKRVGVVEVNATPPPPLPSRPSSSVSHGQTSQFSSNGVMFKNPYNQPQGVTRQRISGLHSSMSSLPRGEDETVLS